MCAKCDSVCCKAVMVVDVTHEWHHENDDDDDDLRGSMGRVLELVFLRTGRNGSSQGLGGVVVVVVVVCCCETTKAEEPAARKSCHSVTVVAAGHGGPDHADRRPGGQHTHTPDMAECPSPRPADRWPLTGDRGPRCQVTSHNCRSRVLWLANPRHDDLIAGWCGAEQRQGITRFGTQDWNWPRGKVRD